jgi:hypothetical protein
MGITKFFDVIQTYVPSCLSVLRKGDDGLEEVFIVDLMNEWRKMPHFKTDRIFVAHEVYEPNACSYPCEMIGYLQRLIKGTNVIILLGDVFYKTIN